MTEITRLLESVRNGNGEASAQLLPLLYDELRVMAARQMAAENPGHTLQPTALVHEAYLRLVGNQHFETRGHFFAAAAQAMRRVLIEHARSRYRQKRGGQRQREPVDLNNLAAPTDDTELLALHAALERLASEQPRRAQLVELRFFGGMTLAEAADFLRISLSTADRDWRYARAWLYAAMESASET